jgi:tetratricopeptide (TPR) repeat protein
MQTLKKILWPATATAVLLLGTTGCEHKTVSPDTAPHESNHRLRVAMPGPLALALAPHDGESPESKEIRRLQDQVRTGHNRGAALERLGWAFVAKARASFDSGFYKLAEACAEVLDSDSPGCAEGLLLRGHVFQNLHRFKEAESVARELVALRGLSFDHGLLGDSLMEQGRVKEAVAAYQTMVDLRPDLQSYSRIAHVRWLTGDLDGAIEMMQAAVGASSPSDPDSAAWANSRLASLQFQSGRKEEPRQTCQAALELREDYPAALLLRGKISLTQDDTEAAIADLERAVHLNPLPEYQWALAEALRAAGRDDEAAAVEGFLCKRGAVADPRTLSLYLATRGEDTDLAVRLAQQELQERSDVFTQDALAWALASAGRLDEARVHMTAALGEGTADARLFFHAAAIAFRSGQIEAAHAEFARAASLMDLLLPSERSALLALADDFADGKTESETFPPPAEETDFSTSAAVTEGN